MTRYFTPGWVGEGGTLYTYLGPRDTGYPTSLAEATALAERAAHLWGHPFQVYELTEVRCLCDTIGVPFTPTCEMHYGTWEDRIAAEPLTEMRETSHGTLAMFVGTDIPVEAIIQRVRAGGPYEEELRRRYPDLTEGRFVAAERLANPQRIDR